MQLTQYVARRCRSLLIVLTVSLVCLPGVSNANEIPGYHNFDQLTHELQELVGAHPNLARLVSVGTSAEGRDIWLVELGHQTGTPLNERPALFVGANFEGNQLVGSEIALQVIEYLLDNYDSDAEIRQRLDNHTVYVFPRVNPDGAERMFEDVETGLSTNHTRADDDHDGRWDEDGPDDLNGDGVITVMRVADPAGDYMTHPDDGRLMKKADPAKGETGSFKIYWEGLDDDDDGFYNEDPDGGIDMNHNFQHAYPYNSRGAGIHMVSELESRAIMDFVIEHRNIALILVFGKNDNLVSAPNSKGELADAEDLNLFEYADLSYSDAGTVGIFRTQQQGFSFRNFQQGGGQTTSNRPQPRKPATTINRSDLEYFTSVSKQYKELTGITSLPAVEKPAGAFFEYGYYQFGVPAFSTPGWQAAETEESDSVRTEPERGQQGARNGPGESESSTIDQTLLEWMEQANVDGFVSWTAYSHPTLGDVEIGGFKPYEAYNPPFDVIEELGEKHGAFVVYLASLFADVRIAETDVTDHGGGVFTIAAEIENAGFLPTSTAHGVTSRSVRPTMVQLGIDPENLLSGDAKTSFFQAMDGSGSRRTFEWIITGKKRDHIELKVVSQKGGSHVITLALE